MNGSLPIATRRTALGLALIALSTLMYEVLLTRIFSVTMWYHFAFVAISIAMFGMTVGALVVYIKPGWFPHAQVKRQLAIGSALFPVVMMLSFLTQLSIPFRVHPSIVAIYAVVFTYAVIAVPFILSGVLIALVLTRFPRDIGRLYAADLIGAALGCVLLVWLLEVTDGPTAVLAIAALAALGAVAFALDDGARAPLRWSSLLAAALLLAAVGHTALVWRGFPVLRILYVKAGFEARPLYERWNSYSRIRVHGDPDRLEKPYTWGLSPVYPADRRVQQLHLDIDVAAGTVLTKAASSPDELDHLEHDVTNIGYYLRPNGRALVVGVGGGRDILSALRFGATSVVGVEINDNIIETLNGRFGDFTGHLDRNPRVTFVSDEARSYIARQNERFDFIQISLIDTWAATAAGAFVLSENSLYTVEAWELFLKHLEKGGILSVSRWYFRDRPGEVYRMTALATAALTRIGVANPQAHMAIVRSTRGAPGEENAPDGIGTLLVSPTPFSSADLASLGGATEKLRFDIVLSPTFAADPTFAALVSGRDLDAFTAQYPINIAPPTDDSPFFFNMLRLGDVLRFDLMQHGKSTHNMEAVFVLGTLLFTVLLLTGLCIGLPLLVATDRTVLRGSAPLVLFFAAIGLGFMLVETSQMQRLIVVLGHPTYGLTVVLFSLLLSSGVGSWLTTKVAAGRRVGVTVLAGLVALLLAFGAVTPWLAHQIEGAGTPVRVMVSALVLAVPGVLMGMAFPLGMRLASARGPALMPWLWGVNGATSVCASVLAVAIALSTTISMAFWAGWFCYAVALGAFVWQLRREPASAVEAVPQPAATVDATA